MLATDIQPQMLAMLNEKMRAANITNVEPILCTPTDAKLPERRQVNRLGVEALNGAIGQKVQGCGVHTPALWTCFRDTLR